MGWIGFGFRTMCYSRRALIPRRRNYRSCHHPRQPVRQPR